MINGKRLTLAAALMLSLMLILAGCGEDSSSSAGNTVAINHMDGFDFSTGTIPADYTVSDGETVGWAPSPSNYVDGADAAIWFRANANDATYNYTKDMGAVELSSVTSVPSTWDGGVGLDLAPLQVGHVYVVKCLDGYAKFKIISIDTSSATFWPIVVEYAYTNTNSF